MVKEKVILWKLKIDITLELLRITEETGLERTFTGHLVQLSCNKQGYLQLDQDALSRLTLNVLDNLCQCLSTPTVKCSLLLV